jgi:hypothetical protein
MGYCVFGRVIQGMDVVEKIAQTPTRSVGKLSELPDRDIVIEKAAMLESPIVVAQQDRKLEATSSGKIIKPSKKGKKRG